MKNVTHSYINCFVKGARGKSIVLLSLVVVLYFHGFVMVTYGVFEEQHAIDYNVPNIPSGLHITVIIYATHTMSYA